jgi:hypothetical protein
MPIRPAASAGRQPTAPTGVSATAGNGQATVSFTGSSYSGKPSGTAVYRATSSPGGLTNTNTASPITVSGLTNGTAYTFTVAAISGVVSSPASAASNSVTPAAPPPPPPPPPTPPPPTPPPPPPPPPPAPTCRPACPAGTFCYSTNTCIGE